MMLKPVIISAPFGNRFSYQGATSTLGTFTLSYRGGALYRAWRMVRTLRYHPKLGGWTNKLGLPNPGIDSLRGKLGADKSYLKDKIVSIYGFCDGDWIQLALLMANEFRPMAVELNLSCPNVGATPIISGALRAARVLAGEGIPVIAKLPPIRWMQYAVLMLCDGGVKIFHCCNTIPTPGGGLSGKALKQYSLWAVSEIKDEWGGGVAVIGGGGVTHRQDVEDYRKAGADHVAIGSVLLNPFNWRRVRRLVEEVSIERGSEK
jgi:dihydroorotate dehydrogenase